MNQHPAVVAERSKTAVVYFERSKTAVVYFEIHNRQHPNSSRIARSTDPDPARDN